MFVGSLVLNKWCIFSSCVAVRGLKIGFTRNVYEAAGRIGRFKFFLNLTLGLAHAALAVLTRERQVNGNQ